MSLLKSYKPSAGLEIKLSPSRLGQVMMVMLHVFFAVILAMTGLGLFVVFILEIVLILHFYLQWRKLLCSWVLHSDHANHWKIEGENGVWEGLLHPSSTVTSWLSVLRFRVVGHRFLKSVVILPDSLSSEAYRRLRIAVTSGLK